VKKEKSPGGLGPAGRPVAPAAPIDPLLVLIVSIWAFNISLVKIALVDFPPVAFNLLRLAIAAAILVGVLLATEKNIRIARKDLPKILLLSFSGYAVSQTLIILGIRLTSATNVAVLTGISPILISLLSSFFKHERISRLGWLGVALGFTGAYIVISNRSGGFRFSEQTFRGDLLVFLAIALWAHFSVSARPLVKIYSPLKFSAVTISLGILFSLPYSLPSLRAVPAAGISARSWLIAVFAGVVPMALGLIIWFNSVKRVGNSQTAVYSNLQPILAIVFAHLLLGDSVGGGLAAGAALVVLGIFLTRRGRTALPEPARASADSP
jgi:drug/metabolite transporter (DMT)-like permease